MKMISKSYLKMITNLKNVIGEIYKMNRKNKDFIHDNQSSRLQPRSELRSNPKMLGLSWSGLEIRETLDFSCDPENKSQKYCVSSHWREFGRRSIPMHLISIQVLCCCSRLSYHRFAPLFALQIFFFFCVHFASWLEFHKTFKWNLVQNNVQHVYTLEFDVKNKLTKVLKKIVCNNSLNLYSVDWWWIWPSKITCEMLLFNKIAWNV